MRYLIDVYTKADQNIVNYVIEPPKDFDNEDDVGRYEWQLSSADSDILISDLVGFAVYHPSMENMEKYKENDGVAVISGDRESVVRSTKDFLSKVGERSSFAGWNIKEYIVPSIYKAFLVNNISTRILDLSFDLYPFDDTNTVDLYKMYNFNGQQQTVRTRNRYKLNEVCFAYGYGGSYNLQLAYRENDVDRILIERIKMAKYLFNKRRLKWKK